MKKRPIRFEHIDKQQLIKMYTEEKMTLDQIGQKLGVADITILRWLRRLGISSRPAGFQKGNFRGKPKQVDEQEVIELYQERKLTCARIGKMMGIGQATVFRILKKKGIKLRNSGVPKGTKYNKTHCERIAKGKLGHEIWFPLLRFDNELGHIVRSSWEQKVFRNLKARGISYKYEPKFMLKLANGTMATWRPDAELKDGSILEVKGPLYPIFLEKVKAFKQANPLRKIILVTTKWNIAKIPKGLFDKIFDLANFW